MRTPLFADKLTDNQRKWYAQFLADSIYRKGWTRLVPRRPNDNDPSIKSIAGAVLPKPRLAEATAPEHTKAGIPEARVYIGFNEYQEALIKMSKEERDGWFNWMRPRRDKWGRVVTSPALYRSHGHRIIPNTEHTNRAEQKAAMKILAFAWLELND